MHTLGDIANMFLRAASGGYKAELVPVLNKIGAAVRDEVEREIGVYQSAISPFPATAQLADATLDRKAKAGLGRGGPDSPLYATGAFSRDIHFSINKNALNVVIGTNTDYILYTELGTAKMPPRPVFGPAVMRTLPKLLPEVQALAGHGIFGGAWSGLGLRSTTFTQQGVNAELQT